MAGSVRNKIRYGTLFLFLLLVLLGGVSIYFLLKTKNESRTILSANYESIDYCHQMQYQLDSLLLTESFHPGRFQAVLNRQAANITEKGEAVETARLQAAFASLMRADSITATVFIIRQHLRNIIDLNMQAIQRKSIQAEKNAEEATTFITVISSIAIIIALSFAFSFPDVVVQPVNKLMEAIGEISKRNYQYRVHLDDEKNEFGQLAHSFNEMAERLEYFENSNLNKIIFEKTRAEAVINSLKDASIGIDKNDVILFANNQALQLLGLGAKDIVGEKVKEVSKRNDLFRYLLEERGTAPFKIVVDNRENYFTKEVMEVPQGDTSNRVIVLKNITSFKELDVAKTNFIATISHELKTPLASSDFGLKLLEDDRVGQLTEEQKELVNQLKNDNRRMLRILSELLNMAQVEAGKMQLDVRAVDPLEIAVNSTQTVANAVKEKSIDLRQVYSDNLPEIKVDAEKTGWVLTNFLNNAIKYAPRSSTVQLRITYSDEKVMFEVADEGPGIPAEVVSKVFDRFFKVPGSKEGTGLGLAISKEFIEAQKGEIGLHSQPGKGSTFYFKLPGLDTK